MDNENINYFFSFNFKLGGIVESSLPEAEVLERLKADLTMIYGDDGFDILEFREASEDEVQALEDFQKQPDFSDETPTIN